MPVAMFSLVGSGMLGKAVYLFSYTDVPQAVSLEGSCACHMGMKAIFPIVFVVNPLRAEHGPDDRSQWAINLDKYLARAGV